MTSDPYNTYAFKGFDSYAYLLQQSLLYIRTSNVLGPIYYWITNTYC